MRRERGRIVGNNMTEQRSDDEVLRLFEAALAGDLQAFGDLLQIFRPQLTAFLDQRIGALLRVRADASDVVQEIALRGLGGTASVQFLRSLGPLGCLKILASHRLAEVCVVELSVSGEIRIGSMVGIRRVRRALLWLSGLWIRCHRPQKSHSDQRRFCCYGKR